MIGWFILLIFIFLFVLLLCVVVIVDFVVFGFRFGNKFTRRNTLVLNQFHKMLKMHEN